MFNLHIASLTRTEKQEAVMLLKTYRNIHHILPVKNEHLLKGSPFQRQNFSVFLSPNDCWLCWLLQLCTNSQSYTKDENSYAEQRLYQKKRRRQLTSVIYSVLHFQCARKARLLLCHTCLMESLFPAQNLFVFLTIVLGKQILSFYSFWYFIRALFLLK